MFLYLGEADAVALQHQMDGYSPLPPFVGEARGVWWLTIQLPDEARVEYRIAVTRRGRRRAILDPMNRARARNPFGSNSVVTGPEYKPPAWATPGPGGLRGDWAELSLDSDHFDATKTVPIYATPGSTDGRAPLLVVHDGTEYFEYAALGAVLDNLALQGTIDPPVVALTNPGLRAGEYTGDDRHAGHIVGEVLPAVEREFRIDPQRRVAAGASLGGVAALHAAWSHPGVFDGLILQSASVVTAMDGRHGRGRVFAPVAAFMARLASDPRPEMASRVHLSCGRYDGLYRDNLQFRRLLAGWGVDVGWEEAPDGHNWENWRDRLRSGLEFALPARPSSERS